MGASTLLYYKTNRTRNGIGLSLGYDIVKAHGGEIKVETKESEGAAFIISLALNENL